MRIVKTIITSTFVALFLMSNGSTYANSFAQNQSQVTPTNITFEVTINGVKHSILTPLAPSLAPVTVKIIKDGNVVFQRITDTSLMVVGDGIDHRVVGDGIDHKVVGDGIDHRVEVSQNGIILFNKQI